jgi:hypothetical protein
MSLKQRLRLESLLPILASKVGLSVDYTLPVVAPLLRREIRDAQQRRQALLDATRRPNHIVFLGDSITQDGD